jgi:hypothetical protein
VASQVPVINPLAVKLVCLVVLGLLAGAVALDLYLELFTRGSHSAPVSPRGPVDTQASWRAWPSSSAPWSDTSFSHYRARDYGGDSMNKLRLRSHLTAIGVLPPNASDDQVAEIISFEAINYSAIGQAEEDQVLAAYRSERNRLYSLPDEVLERIAFDSLRAQLITSISDVLVYESTHWRDQIRGLVKAKIDQYVVSDDAVSLVAHSLGSVVAFDTAYYNSRHRRSKASLCSRECGRCGRRGRGHAAEPVGRRLVQLPGRPGPDRLPAGDTLYRQAPGQGHQGGDRDGPDSAHTGY